MTGFLNEAALFFKRKHCNGRKIMFDVKKERVCTICPSNLMIQVHALINRVKHLLHRSCPSASMPFSEWNKLLQISSLSHVETHPCSVSRSSNRESTQQHMVKQLSIDFNSNLYIALQPQKYNAQQIAAHIIYIIYFPT